MACLLLLASSSPRRRELLSAAGFEFEAIAPEIAERADVNLTPRELTAWNAVRKGLAVARAHPDRVILSADTLVSLKDRIVGKPRDRNHATEILSLLSGKVHEVYSTVFILHLVQARSTMFHEVSMVRFRDLSRRMIAHYLTKVNPLDKAGAYAAQRHGSEIIEAIDGSYTNVVGLPMEKTTAALAEFGVKPANA